MGGYASSGRSEASLRGPTADPTKSSRAPSSTSSDNANPALDNLFRVFLVFQEMRSRGVRPDLRAYNALVNTCAVRCLSFIRPSGYVSIPFLAKSRTTVCISRSCTTDGTIFMAR